MIAVPAPADPHTAAPGHVEDMAVLRAEFKARGFFEHPVAPLLVAWAMHLAIGFGGLYAFLALSSVPARVLAMAVSSFGFVGLATLGHTASHHGVADRRLTNRVLLYFTYPFLLQLSAVFWHQTHCVIHHPNPNLVGIDNDCDLRPFFYINEAHQRNTGAAARFYYKIQGVLFLFVVLFNTINIQRKGWVYLLRQVARRGTRSRAVYIDLACMTAHLVCWIAIPMLFFPVWSVLGLYMLRSAIIGAALFAILAPGHFPAEAMCFNADQRSAGDFLLRQLASTANFRTGPIGRFLCSGLEYQVEHHLFPSVSHIHLPRMAPLVRALCERHGLPYHSLGWGEALWKSYRVLFVPKRTLPSVEALLSRPLQAQSAGPCQ